MADEPTTLKLNKKHDPETAEKINAQLDGMFAKAKAYKAKVAGDKNCDWEKLYDLYWGGERHWKGYKGNIPEPSRVSYPVIQRNVEIKAALIADMDIAAEIGPRGEEDEIAALLIDECRKYGMEKRHALHKIKSSVKDMLTLGTGIVKVYWNYDLDDWDVQPVPPENFYVAPGTTDLTRERCSYVIEVERMSFAEIKNKWGLKEVSQPSSDKDGEFRDDDHSTAEGEQTTMKHMSAAGTTQPTTTTTGIPGAHVYDRATDKEVDVEEWWIDDPDQGKYPNGRLIVRVGHDIVEDKNSPYKHKQWPYAHVVNMIVPHRFWGDTDVRAAGPLQRQINILYSLIVYNSHVQTSAITYTFPNSVAATDMQASAGIPGMVFTIPHPGLKPLRDYPNPLPNGLLQYVESKVDELNKVMRVQDIIPPGSRGWPSSGEVVEQLRESQQVEIRELGDHVAEFHQRITELIAALIQQFYNRKRVIRITGPLSESISGLKDPKTGKPLITESEQNPDSHYVQLAPDNLKGGYDVAIRESVYQPVSKKARFDAILKLAEQFPDDITIEHVLAIADFDGKQKILRDYHERMEAEAEAQEQGPPPGMEGMPPPDGAMPPPGAPPPMGGPPMGPPGMPPGMPPGPPMGPMM